MENREQEHLIMFIKKDGFTTEALEALLALENTSDEEIRDAAVTVWSSYIYVNEGGGHGLCEDRRVQNRTS